MKVVHGPRLEAAGPRWGNSRKLTLSLCILILLPAIGALLFTALNAASPNGLHPLIQNTSSAHDTESGLDMSAFSAIPANGTDDAANRLIDRTSSDAGTIRSLSAEQARTQNALMALTSDVGPPAKPFIIPLGDGVQFGRALDCMTTAIYYEAANEPLEGQRAVAQVIVNRTRHFAYPHSICGVVYQGWQRQTGCQFSFTCDGSLHRPVAPALWARARNVARLTLSGLVYAPVGLATHYHADYVVPYWAPTLVKQMVINRHIFYRWPGIWGTARSFIAPYDPNEPDMSANVQIAGVEGSKGLDVDAPLAPTMTTERPVLMSGAMPVANMSASPAQNAFTGKDKDRVFLMSRAAPAAPAALLAPRRSVTGGAIMPGNTVPNSASTDKVVSDVGQSVAKPN